MEVVSNDSSRELIFIQAGPASNWVGGHFWNLQEGRLLGLPGDGGSTSTFHLPTLFRVSERASTLRYRPRLVALDTLGSVRTPGLQVSAPPQSVSVAWDGDVQKIQRDDQDPASNAVPPVNRHDDGIRDGEPRKETDGGHHFWTDCLLPTVKRRWAGEETVYVNRDYLDSSLSDDILASPCRNSSSVSQLDTENPSAFTSFALGLDLFRPGSEASDSFEENYFHRLVEECDCTGGFCLLADSDNAFAGVALRLGEYLGEEFAKNPVLTYAVASSHSLRLHRKRRSTTLIALNRTALYTGLESGWTSWSAWTPIFAEATAGPCPLASQLAAAIATSVTPFCLSPSNESAVDLCGFISSLTPTRKKMLSLSLATCPGNALSLYNARWNHVNTLAVDSYPSTRNSTAAPSTKPESLACHLSSLGIEEKPQIPHAGGNACSLGRGVDVRMAAHLPHCPLTVPRAPHSVNAFCSQPLCSRTSTVLEAVSHWTDEGQWLGVGLNDHVNAAFGVTQRQLDYGGLLEADELKEKKEQAVYCLLDAYSSAG